MSPAQAVMTPHQRQKGIHFEMTDTISARPNSRLCSSNHCLYSQISLFCALSAIGDVLSLVWLKLDIFGIGNYVLDSGSAELRWWIFVLQGGRVQAETEQSSVLRHASTFEHNTK